MDNYPLHYELTLVSEEDFTNVDRVLQKGLLEGWR